MMISFHIDHLLPFCCFLGVFESDTGKDQLKSEVKTRYLDNTGQCKVGLKVYFTRVDSYQSSNRRLSYSGRSPGILTAKGQINDDAKKGKKKSEKEKARKKNRKIEMIESLIEIAVEILEETETGKKVTEKVQKAV